MRAFVLVLLLLPQDTPRRDDLEGALKRLAADDPEERAAAREAVKKVDRVAQARAMNKRETRANAAIALGVMGEEQAREHLMELTKDKDAAMRAIAYEALGGLKPRKSAFAGAFGDEPEVAFAAARAWARCDPKAREELTRLYRTARKGSTQEIAAIVGLQELTPGSSLWFLRKFAENADPKIAEPGVLAYLQMLTPKGATQPLGGDPGPVLRKACERDEFAEATRRRAFAALGRLGLGTPDGLAPLLKSASADLRAQALKALTPDKPAKEGVPFWLALLEDDEIARYHGEIIEKWIVQATRIEAKGERAEKIKEWRGWLEKWDAANHEAALAAEAAKAIDRGVTSLLASSRGRWWTAGANQTNIGITALAVYALLKSGITIENAVVEKSLLWLLEQPFEGRPLEGGTYRTALLAMVFAEASTLWHPKEGRTGEDLGKKFERKMSEAAGYLVEAQRSDGAWGYGKLEGEGDNSNTQFALLGLRAANNAGVKISDGVWSRGARYLSRLQSKDGGWGYGYGFCSDPYGSMTAAGLCGLLIARATEKAKNPAELLDDKEPAAALKWLEKGWTMDGHLLQDGNIGSGLGSSYYWLWSLERCCLISGIKKIGKHDWYEEGARYLIKNQTKNGNWVGPEGTADQCFALLFLKRAYVPVATVSARKK